MDEMMKFDADEKTLLNSMRNRNLVFPIYLEYGIVHNFNRLHMYV